MNGLEEYTDYVYRVDVTDNNNITIGSKAVVKTYCSGTGETCDGYGVCRMCSGEKTLTSDRFYTQSRYANNNVNALKTYAVAGMSVKNVDYTTKNTWPDGSCSRCHSTSENNGKWYPGTITCSSCNTVIVKFRECANCQQSSDLYDSVQNHICHTCGGTGRALGCVHEMSEEHQYCLHSKTTKHDD